MIPLNLYKFDIEICATAYIKAPSAEAATVMALGLKNQALELFEQDGEIPISGRRFDNPALPTISLSPAMTIIGLNDGATVELSEENVPGYEGS